MNNWNTGMILSMIGLSISGAILIYGIFSFIMMVIKDFSEKESTKKFVSRFFVSEKMANFLFGTFFVVGVVSLMIFFVSEEVAKRNNIKQEFVEKFKDSEFYKGTAGANTFVAMSPKLSEDQRVLIDNNTKYFVDTITKISIEEFMDISSSEKLEMILNAHKLKE